MEVNEIALLLDEALQNVQMNLSGQMQGSQMCENPGGSGQGQSWKTFKGWGTSGHYVRSKRPWDNKAKKKEKVVREIRVAQEKEVVMKKTKPWLH